MKFSSILILTWLVSVTITLQADSLLDQGRSNPASYYTPEKRPRPTYDFQLHDTILVDISILDTIEFAKKIGTDRQLSFGAKLKSFITDFKTTKAQLPDISIETDDQYDAKGNKTDLSKVRIQIPAEVIEILPNGDLVIDATRTVWSGEDAANVRMGGRVNPKYILKDMVRSDKILGLYVNTDSEGPLTDNQKRGMITKFFQSFRLF